MEHGLNDHRHLQRPLSVYFVIHFNTMSSSLQWSNIFSAPVSFFFSCINLCTPDVFVQMFTVFSERNGSLLPVVSIVFSNAHLPLHFAQVLHGAKNAPTCVCLCVIHTSKAHIVRKFLSSLSFPSIMKTVIFVHDCLDFLCEIHAINDHVIFYVE